MKKLVVAGVVTICLALTGCGTDRAESIMDACGTSSKIVAIDDDQVVCEDPQGRQFVREAEDDG